MKNVVLVPLILFISFALFFTPCANLPISFASEVVHTVPRAPAYNVTIVSFFQFLCYVCVRCGVV